ncbi:hypothetical protein Tco_0867434 [Tanacetum coccineum]
MPVKPLWTSGQRARVNGGPRWSTGGGPPLTTPTTGQRWLTASQQAGHGPGQVRSGSATWQLLVGPRVKWTYVDEKFSIEVFNVDWELQLFMEIYHNIKLPNFEEGGDDLWAMEMKLFLEYIDIGCLELWKQKEVEYLLYGHPRKLSKRFFGMDDAKEIWEAIRTRFGGNANSKKMQKAVLKQQFKRDSFYQEQEAEKQEKN